MNERTQPSRNGTTAHTAPTGETGGATAANDTNQSSATDGQPAAESAGPTGLTALIREAEALHEVLSDAKTRIARLIAALRRQKKRDRLVASTLTALKELRLQEVND